MATVQAVEKKTICLNMIVKDESAVIRRALTSVKPLIDYWVIVDTGSTDDTKEIIQEFLKDIPGELHERPWVNFAHNRNEALQLAKGKADFALLIDADEELVFDADFKLPELELQRYYALLLDIDAKCQRELLIDLNMDWEWKGVLHEQLCCSLPLIKSQMIEGVLNLPHTGESARSRDPNKYKKDALLLEAALEKEPNNSRYAFYLAQSYRAAKDYKRSLQAYEKRITMGDCPQEVFWSLYLVGQLRELLGENSATVVKSYWDAYNFRPSRAEPLYRLADHYERTGCPLLGYCIAKHALSIPLSRDIVFVEEWMYQYGALLVLARCAHALQRYDETAQCCRKLLSHPLREDQQKEIEARLQHASTIRGKR